MQKILKNQKGAIAVLFVIMLVVIIAFAGLAVDVGAWFVVRAEISKSADAGALAGAKNISNPYVNARELAEEIARENFPAGTTWTRGEPTFTATLEGEGNNRVHVVGDVDAESYFAGLFRKDPTIVASGAVAQKNAVEIMLVLDRSGSMQGTAMSNLKTAARSFVSYFEDTQEEDRLGLISFAKGVTVDVSLRNNFVNTMNTAIKNMTANGFTNAEDALDRADGPSGFTDQSGLPGDQRRQQYLIFFSDGNPNSFRGKFMQNGVVKDAVVQGGDNFCSSVGDQLGNPDTGNDLNIDPRLTGDGKPFAQSACTTYPPLLTTRWYVFENYPVAGYGTQACYIPTVNITRNGRRPPYTYTLNSVTGKLAEYVCATARQMAEDYAAELKAKNIIIYAIGFTGNYGINQAYLEKIASDPSLVFVTPDSNELESIFKTIAKDIKLRLVQ